MQDRSVQLNLHDKQRPLSYAIYIGVTVRLKLVWFGCVQELSCWVPWLFMLLNRPECLTLARLCSGLVRD